MLYMSAQLVGSLYIKEGNMNGEKYSKVLAEHLGELIFQQDGATYHSTRSHYGIFDASRDPGASLSLGRSLDLSSIESIWGKITFLTGNT